MVAFAALLPLVAACGGGIEITPLPTREPDVPSTGSTTGATSPQGSTGAGDTAPVPAESIVLLDEHWYALEDELGRPVVRWSAIASNQGAHPVTVRIRIEVFDADGRLVGEGPSLGREEEDIDSGGASVFSIGAGPLDAEAHRVEATVNVRQIPDFRQERYGLAVFEGEVTSTRFEESRRGVQVTVTVAVRNTGDAGASVFPRLAVYHAGSLISGGLAQGSLPNLCPGETENLEAQFTFSPPEDFEQTMAEVRAFFNYPEVPVDLTNFPTPEGGGCD